MLHRTVLALVAVAVIGSGAGIAAQKGEGKALTTQDLVEIQQLYARYN